MASTCTDTLDDIESVPVGGNPSGSQQCSPNMSSGSSPTSFVPTRRKKMQPIHRKIGPFQKNSDDDSMSQNDVNGNFMPRCAVDKDQKNTICFIADVHKKPATPKKLANIPVIKAVGDITNNNDMYNNNNLFPFKMKTFSEQQLASAAIDSDIIEVMSSDEDENDDEVKIVHVDTKYQKMQKQKSEKSNSNAVKNSAGKTTSGSINIKKRTREAITGPPTVITRSRRSLSTISGCAPTQEPVVSELATDDRSPNSTAQGHVIKTPTPSTGLIQDTCISDQSSLSPTVPSITPKIEQLWHSMRDVERRSMSPTRTAMPGSVTRKSTEVICDGTSESTTSHIKALDVEKQGHFSLKVSVNTIDKPTKTIAVEGILSRQSPNACSGLPETVQQRRSLDESVAAMTAEELDILNMFNEVDCHVPVQSPNSSSTCRQSNKTAAKTEKISPSKIPEITSNESENNSQAGSNNDLTEKVKTSRQSTQHPNGRGKKNKLDKTLIAVEDNKDTRRQRPIKKKSRRSRVGKSDAKSNEPASQLKYTNGGSISSDEPLHKDMVAVSNLTGSSRKRIKSKKVKQVDKRSDIKSTRRKQRTTTSNTEVVLNAVEKPASRTARAAKAGSIMVDDVSTDKIIGKKGKKKRRKVSALEPASKQMQITRIVPLFPKKSPRRKSRLQAKGIKTNVLMGSIKDEASETSPELLNEQSKVAGLNKSAPVKKFKCRICSYSSTSQSHVKVHMRTHSGERPHICDTCNKGFVQASALKVHIRIHTDERPYSCKVCDRRFRTHGHLADHLRIHTGERPYLCVKCHKTFRISTHLQSHLKIHSNERAYKCPDCLKTFIQSSQLKIHRKIHNREAESKHVCTKCDKRFLLPGNLQIHIKTVHNEGHKPYVCDVCSKSFTIQAYLVRHKKAIHSEASKRRVECPVCRKELSKVSLQHHLLTHATEKRYLCRLCNKGFHYSHGLLVHLRVHSKAMSYHCPICQLAYKDMANMRRHIKKQHRVDPWEKNFKCDTCNRCFFSNGMLSRHQKEVHILYRPFECSKCKRDFKNERNLKQHMRSHDESTFTKCPMCEKLFSQKGNLSIHISTVHEKIKDFSCKICPVKFATKRNLEQHVRTHTGDKPFTCKHCSKKFTQGGSLLRHEMTHTGEKPYKCHLCPKAFVQKVHLTGHLKTHRRFDCPFCDEMLQSLKEARQHTQAHFGDDPYKCYMCHKAFTKKGEFVTHCEDVCHANSSIVNAIIMFSPDATRSRTSKVMKVKCEAETETVTKTTRRSGRKRKLVDKEADSTPSEVATDASSSSKKPKRSRKVSKKAKSLGPQVIRSDNDMSVSTSVDAANHTAGSRSPQSKDGPVLGTLSPIKAPENNDNSGCHQSTSEGNAQNMPDGQNTQPVLEPLNLSMDQNCNNLKASCVKKQPVHALTDTNKIKKEIMLQQP